MATTPVSGAGGPLRLSITPERIKELGQQVSAAIKNGTIKKLDVVGIKTTGASRPNGQDRYEGKTIVENKNPSGIKVVHLYTPDGKPIYTAENANSSARAGGPTHGFFYRNTDFLMDAAKEYAKLGENEMFRYRSIEDLNFITDSLDFFTDGKYNQTEINTVTNQMTDVVLELAQQIKNGESPDLTKVQTKLTIGGVDFTISQLLNFQKVGGELKDSFSDITVGQLDTSRYGKMGLAKSLADYYGSDKGEAGAMFSKAMNRLYDKGVAIVEELAARPEYGFNRPVTAYERSVTKTASAVRDTLATLNTTSKEAFVQDFSTKLNAVRNMVQEHGNRFHVPESHLGLVGDTADLMRYFNTLLNAV